MRWHQNRSAQLDAVKARLVDLSLRAASGLRANNTQGIPIPPAPTPTMSRMVEKSPLDDWLTTAKTDPGRTSAPVPNDFTLRVMARISGDLTPQVNAMKAAPVVPVVPATPTVSARTWLHVVGGTLGFSVVVLFVSGVVLALLAPAVAFALVGALIVAALACVAFVRAVFTMTDLMTANTGLMFVVTMALVGTLLLWSQRAHAHSQITREA